ncbi:3-dehydroquinate synthase [Aquibacillus kalidii]|uniref:3-dehydroquinate synthase n=1 Tax=Aquibacillus kalidii TaxID=2762597 RepID=UPI00164785FA|nr:3-dehydroquinate synthase [Aquibacillus kalidii]
MDTLTIKTSTNKYNVFVGTKLRFKTQELLEKVYKSILIITDSSVSELYLKDVVQSFADNEKVYTAVVPAGESSKSAGQYFDLLTKAIGYGLDRHSLIIALGGGMIGDLAGFVAATFMRGIDYIQMPTTILAHDSSVGGKVAINHPEGKNLIGNFYPPQAVIYDVDTLHSLPDKEVRSGYAEVIKHGMISDLSLFHEVKVADLTAKLDDKIVTSQLLKGIKVKAAIVEKDEKESNIRMFLNFGHTLGHAIEAELGYGTITHGEAVAIGMLFAIRVSEDHFNISLPFGELYDFLEKNNYPLRLPEMNNDVLVSRMKKDKKSRDQHVQMVLLEQLGQPIVKEIADTDLVNLLNTFFRELG